MTQQEPAIRVLVVDDHPLVREGLAMVLAGESDIEVVGTACDGSAAVRLAAGLGPDVVLMDYRLACEDGLAVTEQLRATLPGARVIILTAYDECDLVLRAARVGAAGLLLKDSPVSQIGEAIRSVHAGQSYLSPRAGGLLLNGLRAGDHAEGDPLSDRQREILKLVADGSSSVQIAARLCVSDPTVRRDLYRAIKQLGARDRAEAVARALRRGLL